METFLDQIGSKYPHVNSPWAHGPLECYNCLGVGHPKKICSTPLGQGKDKAGAETCENCKGKGHGKRAYTSSGGQYTDPSLGKGSGHYNKLLIHLFIDFRTSFTIVFEDWECTRRNFEEKEMVF